MKWLVCDNGEIFVLNHMNRITITVNDNVIHIRLWFPNDMFVDFEAKNTHHRPKHSVVFELYHILDQLEEGMCPQKWLADTIRLSFD